MSDIGILSPHDGSELGRVQVDDPASIDHKVMQARAAMEPWKRLGPMGRAEALLEIAERTRRELPRLTALLSREQGKTPKEAALELDRYIGQFVQYSGLGTSVAGRTMGLGSDLVGYVERRPVGVVAAVVPWNFPASLFGTKLAPALAAGCGFIIKPAESTSLITTELTRLAQECLPEHLLEVVIGDGRVAGELVTHDEIARVAFTGSTAVGRRIVETAGARFKRLSLELGGCDPFVVFGDAEPAAAVRALMGTRFYNAGQVCVAPKRLIAHASIADELIARLADRLERVVPSRWDDPSATMGPLHTERTRETLEQQVDDALEHGAQLIGGGRPETPDTATGWFLRPALLLDPMPQARVRTEETFGPVLTVLRFRTVDEAIALANETPYGLGASVWSADRDLTWSVARSIDSGYTWINTIARVFDELPFGGVKDSGVGREHGLEALDSYLEAETYVVGN
jgi:succinate-semialdehyde dehydrogenase/glutarate-semialdehyde dehydrogenase